MPTAAIYARQSFHKEDSCSIDMQIERSKAFCISQGWDLLFMIRTRVTPVKILTGQDSGK